MDSNWQEVLSVIGTIVLMLAVFAAAYFVSKYVGKHYRPQIGFSNNVTVIDSAVIGKDRSILLVKVGDRAFLIGSTPHEFSLLGEFDAGQFSFDSENGGAKQKDFVSAFRDAVKGRAKKQDNEEEN